MDVLMRSDAPLIKGLAKNFGHAVAAEWQKRPCITFDFAAQERMVRWADEDGPSDDEFIVRMPWSDFIMCLEAPKPQTDDDVMAVYLRLATLGAWHTTVKTMSPWDKDGRAPEGYEGGTAIQVFAQWRDDRRTGNELMRRGGVLVFASEGPHPLIGVAGHKWFLETSLVPERLVDFAQHFVAIGLSATAYLSQCPDFIVETRPARPADPKTLKTAKVKPWLRDDLPSFVLIDPEKCHLYRDRPDRGGTHASPRPHHRRGHYKTLTHERYYTGYDPETGKPWRELFDPKTKPRAVFVRPTIVGDPEWVFQGTHYKVINADQA